MATDSVEAADAVASVAAGVEQMVSTVAEIEQQATRSKAASDTAITEAEQAQDSVRGLQGASREIESVVAVINRELSGLAMMLRTQIDEFLSQRLIGFSSTTSGQTHRTCVQSGGAAQVGRRPADGVRTKSHGTARNDLPRTER